MTLTSNQTLANPWRIKGEHMLRSLAMTRGARSSDDVARKTGVGAELDRSCRDYQTLLARLTRLATGEPTSASLSCARVTWRSGAFTARSGVDIAITSEGDKQVLTAGTVLATVEVRESLVLFYVVNEMTVHLSSARKSTPPFCIR